MRGLTTGGDDYVTKPFSLEELIARVRTILRRTGRAEAESSRLVFEDLELDEDTREVTRAGEPIELTATEYRLLRYLMLSPRRVLTRAQLLDHVWNYDFGGDARVLETYVSYLRKKIDVHGKPIIHTVRRRIRAAPAARVMASLRARLIVGLVALAAVGLLALAGITYAEQRSFLLDRVDRQALSAAPFMDRALEDAGVPSPDDGRPGGRLGRGGGKGFGPPPDENAGLPPGTYGQRRDSDGGVLGDTAISSLGDEDLAKPKLPASMPAGRVITVGAQGDSGLRYRAVARPDDRGSGSIVVAVPLTEVDQTLDRLLLVEALVVAAVLLALGALSWFLARIGLRPLDRIGETAGAIAAGDLSRRVSPATPRTEVGRLGIALNAMLGRLEQAFTERQASEDRLRRFLADASHELRTPLASIRGYAEPFRIGAARDAAGTEKAMSRSEGEAARMGVLVEDLLTLARMDEVRELAREDIDLGALASDAVDDARATASDRDISVHAEPPAHVRGDPHQLRQVLANLLRNALVHSPPGTPIAVTVRPAGDEVVIEVLDHGPGIPGEDPRAVFERFWRAEGGRERGKAGAGLGLAIVAAIVDAPTAACAPRTPRARARGSPSRCPPARARSARRRAPRRRCRRSGRPRSVASIRGVRATHTVAATPRTQSSSRR